MGARFSPTARKMSYRLIARSSTIPHDRWGAMGRLVISNADGTNPVTFGQEGEFPWASWSPDGKQLACLNKTGIEIIAIDTKAVVRKMDRKGIYQQLSWSPDGRWFTGPANSYGENWTVVRMDAKTEEVNPVSKIPELHARLVSGFEAVNFLFPSGQPARRRAV